MERRCANCGRPVHTASFTLRGVMTESLMHTIVDGGDADCHLSATEGPRNVAAIACPPGFSDAERDEFIGRLENTADAIAEDIAAERSADTSRLQR